MDSIAFLVHSYRVDLSIVPWKGLFVIMLFDSYLVLCLLVYVGSKMFRNCDCLVVWGFSLEAPGSRL